jgi:hypothetical protein
MKLSMLFLAAIAAPVFATAGGRCSSGWGDDCICLDYKDCRDKWGGQPHSGSPGNKPCPNDPDHIRGCIVKPCHGQGKGTQCLWKNSCKKPNKSEQRGK